jgi:hypothetical protein
MGEVYCNYRISCGICRATRRCISPVSDPFPLTSVSITCEARNEAVLDRTLYFDPLTLRITRSRNAINFSTTRWCRNSLRADACGHACAALFEWEPVMPRGAPFRHLTSRGAHAATTRTIALGLGRWFTRVRTEPSRTTMTQCPGQNAPSVTSQSPVRPSNCRYGLSDACGRAVGPMGSNAERQGEVKDAQGFQELPDAG